MKHCRVLLLILALFVVLTAFAACEKNDGKFSCTLTVGEGAHVNGESAVRVESGESAVFSVSLDAHYVVAADSLNLKNATFDAAKMTVTVSGITEDTEVVFNPTWVDYDTTVEVNVIVSSSTSSVSAPVGTAYHLGDLLTVTDSNKNGDFAGWAFNGESTVVSTENPYVFTLTDKIVTKMGDATVLKIQAKTQTVGVCYYDPNGGTIATNTVNYAGNQYLSVKKDGDKLKTTLSSSYLSKCRTGTALWNDGTFTRDGYILKEYNTKADGTGDAYSPGSKVYQLSADGSPFTLYCIWEAYDTSAFSTESVTLNISANSQRKIYRTGVKITDYHGTAQTVAVPDFIGGEPVIAIGEGAFTNETEMKTLLLPRTVGKIEDGAFVGCQNLETFYYPNGVYDVSDDIFENGDYSHLKTLVVYTSVGPIYTNNDGQGVFALKLSRVLATQADDRIIIVGGSSVYRGLSTEYLQDLLDGAYTVVNFGTTRTTHCLMYVEALAHYLHEGDMIVYAPENSTYLMGDTTLYWKTLRDMEGMNNIFRYVDIGKYDGVFDAFAEYCGKIYGTAPKSFECIVDNSQINEYGDCCASSQQRYVKDSAYTDAFLVTVNEYYRNSGEGGWSDSGYQRDYTDTRYWSKFNEGDLKNEVNRVIHTVTDNGIPVYFGFCPIDESAMLTANKKIASLEIYDRIFSTDYDFTGLVGSSVDYVYAHEYFDDNAFHTNNYGRTLRTYQLYRDLCKTLKLTVKYKTPTALGYVKKTVGSTAVYMYQDELCYFETVDGNISDTKKYTVDFLTK